MNILYFFRILQMFCTCKFSITIDIMYTYILQILADFESSRNRRLQSNNCKR